MFDLRWQKAMHLKLNFNFLVCHLLLYIYDYRSTSDNLTPINILSHLNFIFKANTSTLQPLLRKIKKDVILSQCLVYFHLLRGMSLSTGHTLVVSGQHSIICVMRQAQSHCEAYSITNISSLCPHD